jgi:hypothetical protein
LAGQRDRRAIAEVFGLRSGQSVEVGGLIEGMLRGADGCSQRFLGQYWLISHSAIIATDPQ